MEDIEKKPFSNKIPFTCEECKQDFIWEKVINARLKGEVWEEYWQCPHCGKKYNLGYTNAVVRSYLNIIADAKRDIKNATGERKESLEAFLNCAIRTYRKARESLGENIKRIKELNSEIDEYEDEEEYIKIDL